MFKSVLILLKYIMGTIISLALLIIILGYLFISLSPQFGGSPTKEDKAEYGKLSYYEEGKFSNLISTDMSMDFVKGLKLLPEFFRDAPERKPDFEIPVNEVDSLDLVMASAKDRLVWFGHSAFLLQLDGKNILIDPMLGKVPSPIPILGNPRYSEQLPIEIEQLPEIDLIIISHDHYDHLDYGSISKLKEKTKKYFVPLGVGAHFKKWGIPDEKIHEFEWWEEKDFEQIEFIFAPARHFSGRGIGDRFATLWGSWIIQNKTRKLYFSGDGGYGPHFKEIGDKYGPFDFAMLECGQYNERWKDIHMSPEETAMAGLDLEAKVGMPIHWGAFTLALHSWTDPVVRVSKKAEELGLPLSIPEIGEFIYLDNIDTRNNPWWEN
ncbi:MBL fold metallo-hydrolase [Algoriphagus sediminis]|uniref:MBL fold metallo-hydrolase n=1 Tax=Algoriphagus sediminis TaxID=3057113 RepID=A0ABT7YD51_9BACT|nr:MBL fold metallo-hydrolase [Algoriphagus sediminis]MDN3204457.1 MBL fold metallo-hydrolase [Algoriphagus sediminis]